MEDRKRGIVSRFMENGLVLDSQSLEKIIENDLDVDEIIRSARESGEWLITGRLLDGFLREEEEMSEAAEEIIHPDDSRKVEVVRTKRVFANETDSRLVIHEEFDVTGKSTCDGDLEDFVEYFNVKYRNLGGILRERANFSVPKPIGRVKGNSEKTPASMVCMVSSKREGRSGHRFLEVEDPTGELTVLISKENRPLLSLYDTILTDEVIGISGKMHNDLFIAEEIVEPELPVTNKTRLADEPVYAAFLSDTHVGSYLFLEREFNRFVEWLKGKGPNQEIAEKVKYVMVAGDLVDGVGIYPHQEKELVIPDIYKQYSFLASLIEEIPDYIEVVMSMGNHDAVRNAEPQPRLPRDLCPALYGRSNVHMVGNPAMVSMHGVKALMYHGTTLDTIIGNLVDCTYNAPERAMIEYLKRRHLAPVYGNDSIAPEARDYLAITEIPDILHCGHVHTNGYTNYRGVVVINSGTWQGKTRYQEQLGHVPTPARLPLMNLASGDVSVIDFG